MKKSLIKIAAANVVMCATLLACTGNKDGGGSDVAPADDSNPGSFTEVAKTQDELTKLGLAEDDYRTKDIKDDEVKFDPRLTIGSTFSRALNANFDGGFVSNGQTKITIISVADNKIVLRSEYSANLNGKSVSRTAIEECSIEEKTAGSGEFKETKKSTVCKVIESSAEMPDLNVLMSQFKSNEDCRVETAGGKDAQYESSYGNFRFADGRIVKATKVVYRTKGVVKCTTTRENGETFVTEKGNGESVYVNISTPEMPSTASLTTNGISGLYLNNTSNMVYLLMEHKMENGKIILSVKDEQTK